MTKPNEVRFAGVGGTGNKGDEAESDCNNESESEEASSTETDSGLPTTANTYGKVPIQSCLRRPVNHTDCGNGSTASTPDDTGVNSVRRPRKKFLKVEFTGMQSDDEGQQSDSEKELYHIYRKGITGIRLREPRLSLLGKPINYRAHKRDVRYRRAQAKVYNFLERPSGWKDFLYHIAVFLMVFMCLVLSVLVTIPQHHTLMTQLLFFVEIAMVLWFMLEYVLRVWSAGCRSRYQGLAGRARFARRPSCILDLIIILASIILLSVGSIGQVFATALRGLRFFQILRMVRMDRRGGTWKLLGSVVWAHRQELVTTLYIGFLGLIFSSFLVFLVERGHSEKKFSTYADALWWGVITLCTVGYGDTVPETWAGKLIAAFCAVLGISFFALPAGILGSGFALKVQQQQRQKHLIRRRVPAAMLIQSLWRCYAADEHSISIATWKPHMIPCPSPSQETNRRANSSFVSRFSTRRRDRGYHHNNNNNSNSQCPPTPTTRYGSGRRHNLSNANSDENEIPDALNRSPLSLAVGDKDPMTSNVRKENSVSSFCGKDSEDDVDVSSPSMTQLTETHKKAIRAIRKIRYFVARKKFREALRPYDVKDVIEQYSAGHVDMLSRIKNLQYRLDQILGKAGGKGKDVYESKISLASRVVKVERQVDDIESKLDLLIDMYREDREYMMQQQQVFKALLQSNDQLLTAANVVPLEEPKPIAAPEPAGNNRSQASAVKPRPILVDKSVRGASEPATPTTPILRNPVRPMHRNHSDLGSRVKKKVTYSGCLNLDAAPLRRKRDVKFSVTPVRGADSQQPLNTQSCENIPLRENPLPKSTLRQTETTKISGESASGGASTTASMTARSNAAASVSSNAETNAEEDIDDCMSTDNYYTDAFDNMDSPTLNVSFSTGSVSSNDQTYTVQGEDSDLHSSSSAGEKESLLWGDNAKA